MPLRALHASLHAGRPGAIAVGGLGLVLSVQGLSGLWLYGPALARRSPPRMAHRLLGALVLVFAALVGASGMLLAFGAAFGVDDMPGAALVRHLHYGDFAGAISRIVYAIAGFAVPILTITGYWIVARRPD